MSSVLYNIFTWIWKTFVDNTSCIPAEGCLFKHLYFIFCIVTFYSLTSRTETLIVLFLWLTKWNMKNPKHLGLPHMLPLSYERVMLLSKSASCEAIEETLQSQCGWDTRDAYRYKCCIIDINNPLYHYGLQCTLECSPTCIQFMKGNI